MYAFLGLLYIYVYLQKEKIEIMGCFARNVASLKLSALVMFFTRAITKLDKSSKLTPESINIPISSSSEKFPQTQSPLSKELLIILCQQTIDHTK